LADPTSSTLTREAGPCCGRRWRVVLAVLVVLVAMAVACGLVWFFFFQTYRLMTVREGVLYRDGNRGMREFGTSIRMVAPKTVVCLVENDEVNDPDLPMFKQEFSFLQERGIRLVRIPVQVGNWPTRDDIEKFLSVTADPANQPVLLHCAQGMHRTGILVAAYQLRAMGYNREQAVQSIQAGGPNKRPAVAADLKQFILQYDPVTGNIPPGHQRMSRRDD
jgi:tyrosine-protein phosphatase SIW14